MNINGAFSEQLIECAGKDSRIMVVDPEVARSTKMREFGQAYPDRFFEVGVAEQNGVGISAGLASCGYLPYFVSFSPFATMRPFEMIRTSVAYPNQNVRIVGAYAAFTDGKDGATHEALEDVGMMRTIPNLALVSPSDARMARAIVRASLSHAGPMYIRIENEDVPLLYPEDFSFEIGASYILRQGSDLTIASYGTAVHRALEAAKMLAELGISAEVLDTASLKPFDAECLLSSVRKTGRLITLEDHSIIGGLATIACETLAHANLAVSTEFLGVMDTFGLSGTPDQLRKYFHVATEDVLIAAKKLLEGRKNRHA